MSEIQLSDEQTHSVEQKRALHTLEAVAWELKETDRHSHIPVITDIEIPDYATITTEDLQTLKECRAEDVVALCEQLPEPYGRAVLDEVTGR
jgi:cupin superfamily acireductone dioxygenase involved in methionine salvage